MQPTLSYLANLALQAGEIQRAGYNKDHEVGYKGVIDLVTEVDHQSEAYLLGEVRRDFSDHHIFSEETGVIQGSDEHIWYIDPLDGTVNYAHHVPVFCVSIGYAYKGELTLGAVYDPLRDEMFIAERGSGAYKNGGRLRATAVTELQKSLLVTGFAYDTWNTPQDNFANFERFAKLSQGVRRLGSAALDLCYVASGRFDGYWELSLNPWDVAAGALLCEEAGAKVTNISGGADYLSSPQSILAAAPGIHARMLEELQKTA